MDVRLEALRGAVSALGDGSPHVMSTPDLVAALDVVHAARDRVALAELALLREVDARGVAREAGATSTGVWAAARWLMSTRAANRLVRLAAFLHTAPDPVPAAVADGSVNLEQAAVIARTLRDVPAGTMVEAARVLVEVAAFAQPEELGKAGEHLVATVAPEAAEAAFAEQEQRALRDCFMSLTDEGDTVAVYARMSQETGALVRKVLDPLCEPLPDDTRTPGRRRLDAFEEVFRHVADCGRLPDDGGDRPHIAVTVPYDLLTHQLGVGQLDNGHSLSPGAVRRLACDARITPAVLDGHGAPLDLGRSRRLFTGPLRRALVIRDGGCAWPGCDRPAAWTHGHHIVHWQDGGGTSLDNAVLLCGYHHREIHRPGSGWTVVIAPDGLPTFTPPAYVDAERRPRRNQRYHHRT